MIHLERVALEIKTVGLYDLILQDVQKIAGKSALAEDEILKILRSHPETLEAYKQTNVEYNLSNIHLRDISADALEGSCRDRARTVNANLARLRDIEKYTLDFAQSSTLVIIFSIEFFVLFSVQYFIVLLDLKNWQWPIYGVFLLSIAVAWWYGKKEQRNYAENAVVFERLYDETLSLLDELEECGCVKKADLVIVECDEHV